MSLNLIWALLVPFGGPNKILKKADVEERISQVQVAIDEVDKIL